mmetsp:Transcript_28984/g.64830  ORF Transcript_28984/g.64830 Transcript_28984/m.64830 type:complete len:238 (+) Transcript_28984:764-1477(+)
MQWRGSGGGVARLFVGPTSDEKLDALGVVLLAGHTQGCPPEVVGRVHVLSERCHVEELVDVPQGRRSKHGSFARHGLAFDLPCPAAERPPSRGLRIVRRDGGRAPLLKGHGSEGRRRPVVGGGEAPRLLRRHVAKGSPLLLERRDELLVPTLHRHPQHRDVARVRDVDLRGHVVAAQEVLDRLGVPVVNRRVQGCRALVVRRGEVRAGHVQQLEDRRFAAQGRRVGWRGTVDCGHVH